MLNQDMRVVRDQACDEAIGLQKLEALQRLSLDYQERTNFGAFAAPVRNKLDTYR